MPRTNAVPLWDVEDVYGHVKAVVLKYVERGTLDDGDVEDVIGELVLYAVESSGIRDGVYAFVPGAPVDAGGPPRDVFDPSIGTIFSLWLWDRLPRRLIDWLRREKGDTRYATGRAEFVPLEEKHLDSMVAHDDYVDQIAEAASALSDLARLSDDARLAITHYVAPLARGEKHDDVAERHGISRRKLTRILEDVRNELLGLALGMPADDPVYEVVPPTTDEIIERLHTLDDYPETEEA